MNLHNCEAIAEFVERDYFNLLASKVINKINEYEALKKQNANKSLLDKMEAKLNDLGNKLEIKREDSVSTAIFPFYTKIISFHCDNGVKLLPAFNHGLFFCIKPKLVNELFSKELFINNNFNEVLNVYLFESLQELGDYSHAYETISSVTIILYRVCTKDIKNDVLKHIKETLSYFIMEEEYDKKTRVKGLKRLIKAFILNGIFNINELKAFFTEKSMSYDELRDLGLNYDYDSDESNVEITLGAKLKLNIKEFYDYYPLSLKNLSRMSIKNYMNNLYSQSNVNLLPIPDSIKKFTLFNDEINEILN